MSNINNNTLVSIGMPVFNAEKYLDLAIKSVLAQSYTQWELILIDDGSTDRSLEIANFYALQDSRIRVISDGKNKKLPSRLNQLISESKGTYIARMDADDIMHPERLERQVCYLEANTEFDIISAGIVSIDSKNNIIGYRKTDNVVTNCNITTGFPIAHPTVLARRSWYQRNNYSEDYPRSEDYELWCRASNNNDLKIAILPELLLYYRELGVITAQKMINSYQDSLRVRKIFSSKSYYLNKIKVRIKCSIIKLVFIFDKQYLLINNRNNFFIDKTEIDYHKSIINKIYVQC